MRIVAGKYRRRKLAAKQGNTTRPITDRVKVALFARLEHRLDGARVADVFSGTGTLGLEALSRGAASVVFIENDHRAWELLKENVQSLQAEDETLCWRTDALRSSHKPKGLPNFIPYDIVFFDPPYRLLKHASADSAPYRAMSRLGRETVTSPEALLIVRSKVGSEFDIPPIWTLDEQLQSGTMQIDILRKSTREDAPAVE